MVAVVFVAVFAPVIEGRAAIVGDILYGCCYPWGGIPGHPPTTNVTVGDPLTQFLPWMTVERQQIAAGRLPLWNANALNGVPLLGTGVAAVFSPFTLLALPFTPAWGMSLLMLAKLWIAGLGMLIYLRVLGVRGYAAAIGGIAYGTSSFLVVWLGWPQSSVAALMPLLFAACETYLRRPRARPLAAVAALVGLQFLAGNLETSVQFAFGLALYVVVRAALLGRTAIVALPALLGSAVLGVLLAGIQLLPFVDQVGQTSIVQLRPHAGFAHLLPNTLASWLAPNAHGNPGIDQLIGRAPNFNESTGFIGVGALILALLAVLLPRRGEAGPVAALATLAVVTAGITYGPLTFVGGYTPGLAILNSQRFLAVVCFAVAALAGLGADVVARLAAAERGRGWQLTAVGAAGTLAVAGAGVALPALGRQVDSLLPAWHGNIGFWLMIAAFSAAAAAAWIGSAVLEHRSWAVGGLAALALAEGAIFAAPFYPRVPLGQVPPNEAAIAWLQSHASGTFVAATQATFVPETPTLYGLSDVRGWEIAGLTPRYRTFWQLADAQYNDDGFETRLGAPDPRWLAISGVRYLLTPLQQAVPGTIAVYSADHTVVHEIPGTRPFAFAAERTLGACGPGSAAGLLARDPSGPVIVETACRAGHAPPALPDARAQVWVSRRDAGHIVLSTRGPAPATVVVLQSYWPGWVAHVDGRQATVLPANVRFMAVMVPAGRHVLTLDYDPPAVNRGVAASAVGLGLLAVLLLTPRLRARRP